MTYQADLQGKVALVTGAGRGSGREIALKLAACGAKVCVNDINPDHVRSTVQAIQAAGGEAMEYLVSVDNKMGIQAMVMTLLEAWSRLDILVNQANVKASATLLDMDEWNWDKTLDVNLKGAFLASQVAGRVMREQGQGGVIVNLSKELPLARRTAYLASQMGLIGLTQAVAAELSPHGIRVNLLRRVMESPSSKLLPVQITTVAEAVIWLCQESTINGQVVELGIRN